jgi:hypothetical protein
MQGFWDYSFDCSNLGLECYPADGNYPSSQEVLDPKALGNQYYSEGLP